MNPIVDPQDACDLVLINLCFGTKRILKGGLDCLKLCSKQTGSQGIMEVFTEVFTVMDAWDFVEIMTAKMDYMFESIKTDADLLGLIDLLLEKKQAGLHFIDILGAYLADKKLSSLENPESEVLLEMLTSDADRSPDLHFNHLCYPLTTQELDPVCAARTLSCKCVYIKIPQRVSGWTSQVLSRISPMQCQGFVI